MPEQKPARYPVQGYTCQCGQYNTVIDTGEADPVHTCQKCHEETSIKFYQGSLNKMRRPRMAAAELH